MKFVGHEQDITMKRSPIVLEHVFIALYLECFILFLWNIFFRLKEIV